MDPYLDTIPDDRGEEIKSRVRERDGSDSANEERPTKRARANTDTLLSPVIDDQNIEEPPKPENDLDNYDRERLRKGLRYINEAAKRKITPRTQEFLKLHKDAYKAALEAPNKASQAVVQAMDQVYYSAAFYLKSRSPEEHDRLMCYVKLRQLEFLANYGDYLGQELQEIRADLKAAAIGASSEIRQAAIELGPPQSWLDIADQLAGKDVNNLQKHINVACGILGIDASHMSWLIKEWAQRNRMFHNQIRQHISDCHFVSLAEQLCRDLKELLNVAPDPETAVKYERVLLSIQEEYFVVQSRDDPQYWIPNEKASKLIKEKVARDKKKAKK